MHAISRELGQEIFKQGAGQEHEHYFVYGGVKYKAARDGVLEYSDWFFCAGCTVEIYKRLPPEHDTKKGEMVGFGATPMNDRTIEVRHESKDMDRNNGSRHPCEPRVEGGFTGGKG